MVRIIMHGCNGKMGQVITRMAAEDKECEIVAGIDTCEGRLNGYPVFDSLQDCDVEADVVIDFSNAKAVDGLLETVKRDGFRSSFAQPDFLRSRFRRWRIQQKRRQCSNLRICLLESIC